MIMLLNLEYERRSGFFLSVMCAFWVVVNTPCVLLKIHTYMAGLMLVNILVSTILFVRGADYEHADTAISGREDASPPAGVDAKAAGVVCTDRRSRSRTSLPSLIFPT